MQVNFRWVPRGPSRMSVSPSDSGTEESWAAGVYNPGSEDNAANALGKSFRNDTSGFAARHPFGSGIQGFRTAVRRHGVPLVGNGWVGCTDKLAQWLRDKEVLTVVENFMWAEEMNDADLRKYAKDLGLEEAETLHRASLTEQVVDREAELIRDHHRVEEGEDLSEVRSDSGSRRSSSAPSSGPVSSAEGWVRHNPEFPGGVRGFPLKGIYRTILAFSRDGEPAVEIGEAGEALVAAHLLRVFSASRENYPGWLGLPAEGSAVVAADATVYGVLPKKVDIDDAELEGAVLAPPNTPFKLHAAGWSDVRTVETRDEAIRIHKDSGGREKVFRLQDQSVDLEEPAQWPMQVLLEGGASAREHSGGQPEGVDPHASALRDLLGEDAMFPDVAANEQIVYRLLGASHGAMANTAVSAKEGHRLQEIPELAAGGPDVHPTLVDEVIPPTATVEARISLAASLGSGTTRASRNLLFCPRHQIDKILAQAPLMSRQELLQHIRDGTLLWTEPMIAAITPMRPGQVFCDEGTCGESRDTGQDRGRYTGVPMPGSCVPCIGKDCGRVHITPPNGLRPHCSGCPFSWALKRVRASDLEMTSLRFKADSLEGVMAIRYALLKSTGGLSAIEGDLGIFGVREALVDMAKEPRRFAFKQLFNISARVHHGGLLAWDALVHGWESRAVPAGFQGGAVTDPQGH